MPKICYEHTNLGTERRAIVEQANAIVAEYKAEEMNLTLRQIYYQFVARDLFPESWASKTTGSKNNERSYKNLGECLNVARMSGLMDWTDMVDRTRNLDSLPHWESPASIIRSAAYGYRIDKWAEQPYYVEVWIEKDALEGVIEPVCRRNDVAFFSCRGYVSQSTMWEAGQRLSKKADGAGKKLVVLHLGDHDPSGLDMTNDVEGRLKLFSGVSNIDVRRLALNMDQVRKYNPPPNPCKITDSRATAYIDKHGAESWELDALEPKVLDKLIQNEVNRLLDGAAWDSAVAREEEEKAKLQKLSDNWAAIQKHIK